MPAYKVMMLMVIAVIERVRKLGWKMPYITLTLWGISARITIPITITKHELLGTKHAI